MKSEWIYVIRSIKKKYTYTGITNNIDRRIAEHNKGYSKSTKLYAPFRLILQEPYPNKQVARGREKFLKSGKGREFLAKLK